MMSPDIAQQVKRVLDLGDPQGLEIVVARLRGAGAELDELICDVLAPVQADVGRRWAEAQWTVAEEHRATKVVAGLLMMLADEPGTDDGPHVVVCCADREGHTLAARMIATLLMARDLRVTLVESTTNPADLRGLLERERPLAVALSCSQTSRLPGARDSVRAAHTAGVPVLMGGRGTGEAGRWAMAIGADGWATGPDDGSGVLREWVAATPDLVDPQPSVEAEALREDTDLRRVVVGGNANAYMRGDAKAMQWARAEVGRLVEHLAIAVDVADATVLVEHVGWLRRVLAFRGHDPHTVPAALDDLGAALPRGGTAPAFVRAARASVG